MAHHDSQQLPFELVALEAALKEVVNAAGMQVRLGWFILCVRLSGCLGKLGAFQSQPACHHPETLQAPPLPAGRSCPRR